MWIPFWALCSLALILAVLAQESTESAVTQDIAMTDHAEDQPDGGSSGL